MDGRTDTHHQPLVLALIDLTASKIAAGKNLKRGDPLGGDTELEVLIE